VVTVRVLAVRCGGVVAAARQAARPSPPSSAEFVATAAVSSVALRPSQGPGSLHSSSSRP
jgi:hypothetical protein